VKREDRTRVLIEGNSAIAQRIAAEIEDAYEVTVLEPPHEELIMLKIRESAQNSLFYLCEALMSSCQIRIDATVGTGMVLGDRRNLAYNLALIDGAFSAQKDSACIARWTRAIEDEQERIKEKDAIDAQLLERTRVDFSTMEVDE
jgi:alpha-D-ribose 1-methylphosphonate 5-triphosphate synthase subunit PhnG